MPSSIWEKYALIKINVQIQPYITIMPLQWCTYLYTLYISNHKEQWSEN